MQPSLLIVHDSTALGGAERVLLSILKLVRGQGIRTYLLTSKKEALYEDFCALTEAQLVLPFPYPRKVKSWINLPNFYLKTYSWVRALPQPMRILSGDYYSLWASLLLQSPQRPVFSFWQGELRPRSAKKWTQYGANRAHRLITSSPARQAMQKEGGLASPIIALDPMIDIRRFDPSRYDRIAIRQSLGLGPGDKIALCTGRVGEGKGQRWLAEAFLQDSRLCDWHLVIAGPINEGKSSFEAMQKHSSAHRLHVLGPRSDIPELLSIADLAIFPGTTAESFGLSIVEAALMGRPILATATGAIPYNFPGHPGFVALDDRAHLLDLWATHPLSQFIPSTTTRNHLSTSCDPELWAERVIKIFEFN